ncbi:hypothetical protein [Marinobacterium marinum]|uniref:Uncharacterized protein n=1 Tax=Marinobacterium marinum TaxID=2756129 RepID=A0A7W2AC70_9GAMM|nr:hypothetical protein [Marinobacterium marinum]MBA4501838.1 hypothetical protein [Marinobacterium marinum]
MSQIPEFLRSNEFGQPYTHALSLSIEEVALPHRYRGDAADAVVAMNNEIAAAVAAVDAAYDKFQAEARKHAPQMTELDALIDRLTEQASQYRDQLSKACEPQPESVSDLRKRLDIQAAIIAGADDAELLESATDADGLRVLADTARACKRQPLQEAAQARLIDIVTDGAADKLKAVEAEIMDLTAVRDRCRAGFNRAVASIGPHGRKVERDAV